MNELYDFERLARRLDEWRFPRFDGESGFKVIKGIDFEEAYKAGSISFEDDGIYLEYEGKKYRGYMFIKEPYISVYGSYPKFHLTRCKIIEKFIAEGRFKIRYDWSNSNVNDLIDKTTREVYSDEVLEYCHFCRQQLFDGIRTTEDFFGSLDKSDIEGSNIQVDIFGYVKEKVEISRHFREKMAFKCDVCGIQPFVRIHRRYWHTHHRDGDKLHNKETNLQCLCVLCHCYADLRHEENFDKGRMKDELNSFVELYKDKLKKLGNPYLDKFNIEIRKREKG